MSSTKVIELTESNTCNLCNNAVSKYSCPRCNILYCSVKCYQSPTHAECSETFYKDCVLESLDEDPDTAKSKMIEILNNFHKENKLKENADDEDEDEYSSELDSDDEFNELYLDIGKRLENIDLDDPEKVWEKLNNDERQEFEAFLMSDNVSQFIPMWESWWEYQCEKRMIEVSELEEKKAACPKIVENIKPFSEMTSKPPAACVQHNLINVIAAYAFTLRYFNGEQKDFFTEIASCIFSLSLNLKNNQNFDSFNQAVDSVKMTCTNDESWLQVDEENLNLIKVDVCKISSGPHATEKKFYLMCALSDMINIFNNALQTNEVLTKDGEFYKKFTENQFSSLKVITNEDIKKTKKKLEYFLSFCKFSYDI